MNLHRVRRLAWVLVASQIRASGRGAHPKKATNQPAVYGWAALVLAGVAFAVAAVSVRGTGGSGSVLPSVVKAALPFLPLVGVGTVLVAGLMFELTTTAKFASSDAANWLPLRPQEYVLASAIAVAYTYSAPLALVLGAIAGVAVDVGLGGAAAVAAALSVLGLLQGALWVEMVRAVGQRAGGGSARRGRISVLLRALAFVVLVVVLELAFNPVVLLDSLSALQAFGHLTELLPPFWGSYAVLVLLQGNAVAAGLFAAGTIGFSLLLLYSANLLRQHFWSVAAPEYHFGPYRYGDPHPALRALGLSIPERALVAKDLHGFGRRREMMPMLLLPVVLLIVIFLEGSIGGGGIEGVGLMIYAGWAATFAGLLIATTSLGQERRSLWHLYAAPISAREIFRAKIVAALIPAGSVSAAVALFVGFLFRAGALDALGLGLAAAAASFAVSAWGLGFAARYSDYQERPRPQPMRPGAMLVAVVVGSAVALSILVPATLGLVDGGAVAAIGLVAAIAFTVAFGATGWLWARAGFVRLMREIPF